MTTHKLAKLLLKKKDIAVAINMSDTNEPFYNEITRLKKVKVQSVVSKKWFYIIAIS